MKVVNRHKICQFTMSITYQPSYEMWPAMRAKNFVKSYATKFGKTTVLNHLGVIFPEKFDGKAIKGLRLNHFENMSLLAYIMGDGKPSNMSLYDFERYVNPITFAKKRLLMSQRYEFMSLMGKHYEDMQRELENVKRAEMLTKTHHPTWMVSMSSRWPQAMTSAIRNLRKTHSESSSAFKPIDSPPREDVTQVEHSVDGDEAGVVEDVTQVEDSVEDRTERLAAVLEEASALDQAEMYEAEQREYTGEDEDEDDDDYDSDDSDYEDKVNYAKDDYYCCCCYR